MTSAQKIIKYFAIAFAAFLIVTIVSGIINVCGSLIGIFKKTENVSNTNMINSKFENSDVATLNVEIAYTNLKIKTGEYLHTETNNSNINCIQDKNKIEIIENHSNWPTKSNNEELVIYIPENLVFEYVNINAGAGKIDIEKLSVKEISFELGAGKVEINNLQVSDKAKIEGGAGKLDILSGSINNLKLDIGIGETNIYSKLLGNSKINAGVGNLNIHLLGDKENYKIQTSKGLGTIKVDNKTVSDSDVIGNGNNYIDVEGGIGNIDIVFNNISIF